MEINEPYLCFINNANIQQLFEKNQASLIKAYKLQNSGQTEEACVLLEDCRQSFIKMGSIIDKTSHGTVVCRENREVLSSHDVKQFLQSYPHIKYPPKDLKLYKASCSISKKPKQKKSKWTVEEEKKFQEGLEVYGKRSKRHYKRRY